MRRYIVLWTLILAFVAANVIVFCFWPSSPIPTNSRRVMHVNPDVSQAAVTERLSKAESLMREWNRGISVELSSPTLRERVADIPKGGCLGLTAKAVEIPPKQISDEALSDLQDAVAGLLRAYSTSQPEQVIQYMAERGKTVDPSLKRSFTRSIQKRQEGSVADLSLEDLYITDWKLQNLNPHWKGLIVASCCEVFFDGRDVPYVDLTSFNTDYVTNSGAVASQLVDTMSTLFTFRHSFVPTQGDLQADLASGMQVLCADVLLIIELDKTVFGVKKPYLVRFWHNSEVNKWQPLCLVGFGSHPSNSTAEAFYF